MTQTGRAERATAERPEAPAGTRPVAASAFGWRGGAGRPRSAYDRVVRLGVVAWALVGIAIAGFLGVRLLQITQVLVPPVLLAMAIVYLLNPLVTVLQRRGLPRLAGTFVVYLGFALLVSAVVALIAPLLTREVAAAIEDFPEYSREIEQRVNQVAARFDQQVTFAIDGDRVQNWLSDPVNRETVLNYVTGLGSVTSSVLHGLVVFVIGLIVAFYLLVDLPRLRRGALAMVPPPHRADLDELSSKVGRAVGGFFRGQLLVALFVGVASSLALRIVGLPFWLLVGLVAGVFNLVPLIGPWIAGALAVVIALLDGDPLMALWAGVALLVVQQIDNHLVSPNVMSRTVHLHPVVVILALLLGATFYGIIGMLIAVPLVAASKIIFMFLWVRHVDYGADLVAAGADPGGIVPAPPAVPTAVDADRDGPGERA
jgi:predicted PurR-regulated permease PerM